jgi:hypothetical protein
MTQKATSGRRERARTDRRMKQASLALLKVAVASPEAVVTALHRPAKRGAA